MQHQFNRRRFMQAAAVGSVGFWTGTSSADDDKKPSANDKLHVGVVGCAGQGNHDWTNIVAGGAEVVAWCDVDEKRTDKARARFPKAPFYTDFRKMLEQKDIDAVVVATPDHTHAIATLAALRSGRHVFCEKPLTHTVQEARLVAETAAKMKRVTQMGTQIHAENNYRRVVELVESNAIGPVKEVHVWCEKSWGGLDRPTDTPPVPEKLDYDLWLGPAPYRPFHKAYVPYHWRGWWDFGGGTLADMGCHYTDLAFWALKLRHPTRVAAEGPKVHPESTPIWLIVNYEFPARDKLPPVKLTWYDGVKKPALVTEGKAPKWGNGVLFVGEKGMLIADYGKHKLLPEKEFEGFEKPKPYIPKSVGHYKEWVEACKSNGPTTCNFDYAGALTEAILLGNVAYRSGQVLEWDATKLAATNAPEAARYTHKEYRKPWTLLEG